MDAFEPIAPEWTAKAIHAHQFCCPTCQASSMEAKRVWINRRSPVYGEDRSRKWQEFYECECSTVWWAWSSDRPPSPWGDRERGLDDLF
ncbi:hypothetical protein JJD41_16955 [Oxynema sp. CENA135]|uniref:hypothetical protein n=1 Tax=Oxynema sp. CENA135 TaxID=984206 RepID=UPI00190DBA7E|nr:hypothetical protein [Oxynema sp. CENA135]MBK4731541.1 hypothetical protein [Oxynema sp. CENA135]